MYVYIRGNRRKIIIHDHDVCNLSVILAQIIAESLRKYLKHVDCVPNDYAQRYATKEEAMKAWINDLKKMETAFRLFLLLSDDAIENTNSANVAIREGLELFCKRFSSFPSLVGRRHREYKFGECRCEGII